MTISGRPNGKLFGFSMLFRQSKQPKIDVKIGVIDTSVSLISFAKFQFNFRSSQKKETSFICSIGTRKFIQATEIRLKDRNIGRMIVQNEIFYIIFYTIKEFSKYSLLRMMS